MRLRRARPDEADAVTALVRAAYAVYIDRIGREPAPMGDDYAALIRSGCVFVPAGGPLDGVLVLRSMPDHLLLETVAVAPDRQGKGLGRALVAAAEAEAEARGMRQVRLYTNAAMTENLALYPRLGYRETHRATQAGFQRVFYEKDL